MFQTNSIKMTLNAYIYLKYINTLKFWTIQGCHLLSTKVYPLDRAHRPECFRKCSFPNRFFFVNTTQTKRGVRNTWSQKPV